MGALCCNHASMNPSKVISTSVHPSHGSHGRLPTQLEHSPTHPHHHQLSDRSESTLRCLARVERMNWEQADRELAEFLLNEYPSQCRWSYSPEQRAALLAWRRISGRGRYRPARS